MGLETATAIGLGLGGLQTVLGIVDKIGAGKRRKEAQSFFEKNQFDIPESAKAALTVAEKQAASGRLPYEDITRAQMGEATGRGVQAAKNVGTSSSDIMAQMASLFGNQQRQEGALGVQAGQRYDTNQRYLGQALGTMANWEKQKWDYNVLYPYQQMMETAGQKEGTGNQMIGGGIGQVGQAIGGELMIQGWEKELEMQKQRMGLGGSSTSPVSRSLPIPKANAIGGRYGTFAPMPSWNTYNYSDFNTYGQ